MHYLPFSFREFRRLGDWQANSDQFRFGVAFNVRIRCCRSLLGRRGFNLGVGGSDEGVSRQRKSDSDSECGNVSNIHGVLQ